MKQNEKVDVNSLIPPFDHGDWITYTTDVGRELAPKGRLVWRADGNPTFVGCPRCGSGWQYLTVDSAHFRRATTHDIKQAVKSIDRNMKGMTIRRKDLEEELMTRKQRGYR